MTKRSYLGIRISRDLKRQLLEEAAATGQSLSEIIRRKLDPYVDVR